MEPLRDNDPRTVGNWTLQGRLGSGGTGVVYKAVNGSGFLAAIKVLRPELADSPLVRERLRREAEVLKRVKGGRTAEVFEVASDIDTPYIAMQLVEGVSLNEFVENSGAVKGTFAWALVEALIEALKSIHAAGIIHRDLKPSNIIVGPDGVKVVDFGISVLQDAASSTQTGAMLGTVAWLSPEQITGQRATEKSDVFNLGMVLAYALTGQHPYGEGRPDAIMFRIAHGEPNLEGLPTKFSNLLKSCLDKDPAQRLSLQEIELKLSDVSKSGSSDQDVPKIDHTLIVDRTMLETSVQSGGTRINGDNTSTTATGSTPINKFKSIEAKILLAMVAAIIPVIFFVINGQNSNSGSATSQDQLISSTSLELLTPTTILGVPEFKVDEYEGRGLRWDGCAGPITVAINYGTAEEQTANNVTTWTTEALSFISGQSGLEFIFTGASDRMPKAVYRDGRNGSAAILIGLLKPGEMGATLIKLGENWSANSNVATGYQSSSSQWTPLEAIDVQLNTAFSVSQSQVRRELLKAIGLDFVNKSKGAMSNELMAVYENSGGSFSYIKTTSEWGPGDILGMKAVGTTNGCISK